MALIHPDSKLSMTNALDLFEVPTSNTSIHRSWHQAYSPISALTDSSGGENGVFEFSVNGSSGDYLDLSQTFLYLQVSIRNEKNEAIGELDEVGPVDNLFHSLFSQYNVSVQDQSVTVPTYTTPWKAYIENLLNYGTDSFYSKLTCQLNIPDTPGHMNALFTTVIDGENRNVTSKNKGLLARREYFVQQKNVELIGKPLFNLSCQPKLLMDGITVKFSFNRQKDAFCLMCDPTKKKYKLIVTDAVLYINKVNVDQALVVSQQKILNVDGIPAKYFMRSGIVRKFAIPQGMTSISRDNLGGSLYPNRMFVFLTSSKSANGSFDSNPFNFHHYNTNFFAAYLDGVQYPFRELKPDFSNNQYLCSYFNFLSCCDADFNSDKGILVTRDAYAQGTTIFAADFSCNANYNDDAFELVRNGSVRLEIRFATPTIEPVDLYYYCEYQTVLQVNFDKSVKFDNVA